MSFDITQRAPTRCCSAGETNIHTAGARNRLNSVRDIAGCCNASDQSSACQWWSYQNTPVHVPLLERLLLTMSNSLHWNLLGSFWQSVQAGPSAQGVQVPEIPARPCSAHSKVSHHAETCRP